VVVLIIDHQVVVDQVEQLDRQVAAADLLLVLPEEGVID